MRNTLILCCVFTFACYFAVQMRLPLVPLYAHSLGMTSVQIGIINSAYFLMAGCLSFPMGMASDRMGPRRVALFGVFLMSVALSLLCLSKTFVEMTGIYLLLGMGIAAFGPTMMSYVAEISPPSHLGRSYGWYTTALFCGTSLGPGVGGFMAEKMAFSQVFLLSGIFIFVEFWLILLFLPLRDTGMSEPGKQKNATDLKALLKNYPLLGCWLTTLGGCFGLGMFVTFLPLHARNQGLDVGQIGLVFFVQGLFNALSRIPFGNLSDKIADRSILVVAGIIGFAGSMVGFGLSERMSHFMIFAVTLGVSMGLAFTSVGALIAGSVPAESRGLAMGGYNTCIYFGLMSSSGAMGSVIQEVGFANGFFITALLNLILIGFSYLLIKQRGN